MYYSLLHPAPAAFPAGFLGAGAGLFVFGNAFLELRSNMLGEPLNYGTHWRNTCDAEAILNHGGCAGWQGRVPVSPWQSVPPDDPDINQEIYGMPEYLGALLSAACLIRRTCSENCITTMDPTRVHHLHRCSAGKPRKHGLPEETLQGARGGGAFKNVLIHAPTGAKRGCKFCRSSRSPQRMVHEC